MELRPYQQDLVNDIIEALDTNKKVLGVLPTGGGKSVVIADILNRLEGRTLILTHRSEILKQNASNIQDIGVLTAKSKYNLGANTVIAMVETFYRRAEKHGYDFIGEFDNVLTDESHILIFQKVYDKIKYKNLVGFTATPTLLKQETIEVGEVEYIKKLSLGDYFDVMIEGPQVSELIDLGFLSKERAYALKIPNFTREHEKGGSTDYTSTELNTIYANKAARKTLLRAYEEHCVGKKTIIFNATTKVNLDIKAMFDELGIKNWSFDSVNNSEKDRAGIISEFRKAKEGVLIGTNVFTTGFDVSDIDVVIVNRATKSLSLWIQMVGRASRIAENKEFFKSIDLGQNVEAFGKWSDEIDWDAEFKIKEPKKKFKTDILQVWECKNCGAYNVSSDTVCVVCGVEKEVKVSKYADKNGVLVELDAKPTLPSAMNILKYTKRHKENSSFAFKLLDQKIIDLMTKNDITSEYYKAHKTQFESRIRQIYNPIYFAIINSNLKGKNRRLSTQLDKLYKKIKEKFQ